MHRIHWLQRIGLVALIALPTTLGVPTAHTAEPATLTGTDPLDWTGDVSRRMVSGIDRFLTAELDRSPAERQRHWQRDFASPRAYDASVQPNRERLRTLIGAVDPRVPAPALEFVHTTETPALIAETGRYSIQAVRWPVFEGVYGEGLWLTPKVRPIANVVALPDADQTPEDIAGLNPEVSAEHQWARRLAEQGCQVLVLTLLDRRDTASGNPRLKRFTNQPHREWVYRQAYEMGRHPIGYEVQTVLAALDLLTAQPRPTGKLPIGVAGYGEGALIALYAAALDLRIEAALVSGYFDSRQAAWEEPIYRNLFGLLGEFGDAEIASLVASRPLIIEHSRTPIITGPPKPRDGRRGAAPGRWSTPDFNRLELEVMRAEQLVAELSDSYIDFVYGNEGMPLGPGSEPALRSLLNALGVPIRDLAPAGPPPVDVRPGFDPSTRQQRLVEQWVQYTQRLLHWSESVRDQAFSRRILADSPAAWQSESAPFKTQFWDEVIGRFPPASLPANPRSRRLEQTPEWTRYDVVLDVWPEVFAWGVLLLPKDLQPGERRPVVVCQHGLEGLPADTLTADPQAAAFRPYQAFAARLAERGFIVFAPHNPYRGQDAFRVLQRKANLLGKSLFSVILAQHDRILDWLAALPFVDPERIGFYGLSYGGKTAMRVPALLDRYALSICSADFNEWIRKNVSVDSPYSYMFTGEYEMPEFNLGHTFNYAEMAALIAPRPFMVERGHHDGVAPDEWVAYEYAKVRRFYARLGIPERTAIEFFDGPHAIHGVGTFDFLHHHLRWPKR